MFRASIAICFSGCTRGLRAFHFKREIGISSIWSVGKLRPKKTSEIFFFNAISSSRVFRRYPARR
jgi:hypothetical protein